MRASTPSATAISVVSSPTLSDTYRLGEAIEFEVTFSEAVNVMGTPQLALVMRDASDNAASEFRASYVRGTGTTKLVFAYTVAAADRAAGGLATGAALLQLNGATITAVSDRFAATSALTASEWIQASGSRSKVDGSLGLTGGVCGRTLEVRDAIVAAVSAASNCTQVTDAHLSAITGTLTVSGLTSLEAGDFARLSGVTGLTLTGSGIETLPVGLFDGLDSLTSLSVVTGLTHLPKDVFRGLGKVTSLQLWRNAIVAGGLPDGIFEPLTKLTTLDLDPNPGAASFRPAADAGAGETLSAGETVTLGGPGTSGGPWGSNVTYAWTQTDGEDMEVSTVTLSATDVAKSGFIVPALAAATDVKMKLAVGGRGGAAYSSTSTAEFTIRALAPSAVEVVSEPVVDSTYKQGETIEIAVTFGDRVLVDTSLGTPGLTLSVGVAGPRASYVRGSGTNRLVFAYTVGDGVGTIQTDTDGISVLANALALNGGVIASLYGAAAVLDHDAVAAQSGHKVDGSTAALTGGVCGRTPQIRDKLVDLVKANDTDVTNCSLVTTTHLGALTGPLNLSGGPAGVFGGDRLTGLKVGDFAGLTGITSLNLGSNRLRDIPAGVFDPLKALTRLQIFGNGTVANDGLTALPPGLFDRLTGLTEIRLDQNDLSSLPPRIFEKLTALTGLTLNSNPGSASFVPIAKAGPEGGIEVASGGTVTLGDADAAAGYDDPWGKNVIRAWSRPEGAGGTLADTAAAQATFTAPVTTEDETHSFRLTVTGRGGSYAGAADVTVRVAAGNELSQGLGICGRSPAVQAAILARVQANDSNVATCAQVTAAHLSAVTGTLDVSAQVTTHGRMTALSGGDFAGLTGLTGLDLDNHALRVFPTGIFDPMTSLTELSIAYNQTQAADRMTTLPAGLFDRLTGLTALRLEHNDLETLPDRIFEKLTNLATLTFNGNPGNASFLPVAVAGPAGGFDAKAGDTVTLGGDAGGPWGSNLVYSWSKTSGTTVDLSATDVAKPTLTAPALAAAAALEYGLTVTARGTSLTATDSVTVRVAAAALVSSVAPVSGPVSGDTYRRGEMIEIAVTFGKPVTVTGTPQLALAVGTATRQAAYARGTGTNRLVFAYSVAQGDTDTDGIAIAADRLTLAGSTIRDADGVAASLDHAAVAAQSGHKVDGSTAALTGGVCGRTAQIRDKLVDLVRTAQSDNTLDCSDVTNTHLGALTGTLNLSGGPAGVFGGDRLTGLKVGDFAGLTGITSLNLGSNRLRDIPAGVFDPLTALTRLQIFGNGTAANDGLTALPPGLFDRLTGLTEIRLDQNDLSSLPPRIFEKLTALTGLTLSGNPGSASFVPTAKAGPEGGIEVAQGATATLGFGLSGLGQDDPWGANVTYSWRKTAGSSVTLSSSTAARPTFTAPSTDETMTFELTVTGKGGSITATDTVSVRVGTAGMRPMPKSAAVEGPTLTLTYDEDLQTASPAPATGKGPVYLAVVSGAGSATQHHDRTSNVGGGERAHRHHHPRSPGGIQPDRHAQLLPGQRGPRTAGSATRVGNLANAFAGLRVRNDTPEGPHVDEIAFTGTGKTYRIGDTVEIDVTFSEAVTVTGRPTLVLDIGGNSRKAGYVSGSGSAVLRFEYTVAAGDLDTDGLAVKASGLETPSGVSIVTVAIAEAVILRHGSFADPAHKVDGVLPTADAASVAGPTVTVTWSEALDEASAPAGAGGFTVRIATANDPNVTAVAVSGSTTVLSLASAIPDGTPNVTLEYDPPGTGAKIRDAAGNDALGLHAGSDALEVTVTPDTRAPVLKSIVVDGATLTMTYDEVLKVTSPVTSGGNQVYNVGTAGSNFTVCRAPGPASARTTPR